MEEKPNENQGSLTSYFVSTYGIPLVKISLGLGLVLVARKIEVSNNPIFVNSLTVDILVGSARIFGVIAAFHGMGHLAGA